MLIHIGYHKTASTWLQKQFFPKHPQIDFIAGHQLLWPHLINFHPLLFNAEQARTVFSPLLQRAEAAGKLAVLSSERLSGNPHSGAYDNTLLAERLQTLFPQAKILLMVREQTDAIVSNYKQYIKMRGLCTLDEYLNPPVDGKIPLFRLDNFQYHYLAAYYVSLFGENQVKVMCYEQLRDQAEDFIQDLSAFAGISDSADIMALFPVKQRSNAAFSDGHIRLRRYCNRLSGGHSFYPLTPRYPRLYRWLLDRLEALERAGFFQSIQNQEGGAFRQRVQQRVQGRYAASNRALQQQFQLDLAQYGYQL
ncbi:sulfotransferase [Candidatus Venteria ishoeyi]|nr:sulfotransferase [Candidatus Venteria ishoeyi]